MLNPCVNRIDNNDNERTTKAVVLGRVTFSADELNDDVWLQSVLLRDNVFVELEADCWGVVVRVRGLMDRSEHDRVCGALMHRCVLLERKLSAICADSDVRQAHRDRLPNLHAITWLAHVHVHLPSKSRRRHRMKWRFVPFFALRECGERLAGLLMHAARHVFDTEHLFIWFGIPNVSMFQLEQQLEVSVSLKGTFSPMPFDESMWMMRHTPTGSNVVGGDGAPCGFFALSNVVDVGVLAAFVWKCLDRSRRVWCSVPTLPVGVNQRVVFSSSNEPRVDPAGAKLDANAVVVLAAIRSLHNDERASAFLDLVRQCRRVEVIDVAHSRASDAVLQETIDAAHTHVSLRCVLVNSATFHSPSMRMGVCCVSSSPDDAADDAAAVHLERMFAIAAFPW